MALILLLLHTGTITFKNVLVSCQNILKRTCHLYSKRKIVKRHWDIQKSLKLGLDIALSKTICSIQSKWLQCFKVIRE